MKVSRVIALVLLAICVVVTARAQQGPSAEKQAPAAPAQLTVWNRPIVSFRAAVAGATPEQRVRNARARIDAHASGPLAPPVGTQDARISDAEGIAITVGGNAVFGVVPGDLDAESAATLEQVAGQAAAQLRAALEAREQQRRLPVLMRGIGLAVLILAALAVVLRLIFVGREAAVGLVDRLLRGRQVSIAGIDIVPTLATVERATFRVLSWGLIAAASYIALTLLLNQFPYTAPLGERLGARLAQIAAGAATTVLKATPSLVAVIAVLMITRAIALWVSRLLAEVEHGARTVPWLAQEQARATRRIASGVIWILGCATAYPLLPWSGSLVFQGMSVVLGLVVSLASSGLIGHWISGLVILYSRSFRVGDFVGVGDVEGFVTELGPLATKLRTMRREEITIPNGVMTTEKLTNYTRMGEANGPLLSTPISIGYDAPWRQVSELLLHAAAATPGVRADPAPRVLQWELNDFYVTYLLHVYLDRQEDRVAVRSDLNARILDAFSAAGVQIMTPHFESQPEHRVIAGAARLAS